MRFARSVERASAGAVLPAAVRRITRSRVSAPSLRPAGHRPAYQDDRRLLSGLPSGPISIARGEAGRGGGDEPAACRDRRRELDRVSGKPTASPSSRGSAKKHPAAARSDGRGGIQSRKRRLCAADLLEALAGRSQSGRSAISRARGGRSRGERARHRRPPDRRRVRGTPASRRASPRRRAASREVPAACGIAEACRPRAIRRGRVPSTADRERPHRAACLFSPA